MTEERRRACLAGIGETRYTKWGGLVGSSEYSLAIEAIQRAVADAGLSIDEVDGFSSFAEDRNDATFVAADLGINELRFAGLSWLPGGGGACAAVANAALAVEAGAAEVVVAYRSLCQGQFRRFGRGPGNAPARPATVPHLRKASRLLEAHTAFTMPFGMFGPPIAYAMVMQRYMHLFGATAEQMGEVAVVARAHAARNPRAVMGDRPMTMEDYLASRMVSEPFRLFDCCLENDGACAVVVTTEERARDLAHPVVAVLAGAQGTPEGFGHGQYSNVSMSDDDYASSGARTVARRLWARAGLAPADIDVAQIYDHFSGLVLMSLEDFGFCGRGEGGAFVEGGTLAWPHGSLITNTHGGSLSEAYIHGLNHVVEGVRQLRGDSTCQVEGARTCLVTSAAGVPTSALVLGRP
jgi:acetyl-CoA acetyltransferase